MKRFTFISMLALLIPLTGIGQNSNGLLDDIYFKPSDAKKVQQNQVVKQKPTRKNGAKEIVYIERETKNKVSKDSSYVLAQANDSIMTNDTIYIDSLNNGYYLNGFKGSKSDYEYAERIRRFHNPKYTILISDPRYNDIYFLNNDEWNVYVDGPYAYVTPTWINPAWWNYNTRPYGYGNWGWGNYGYNPYYGYGGGWCSPWGYNDYYGYGGFGGFGYGYPYYGFGYGDYYCGGYYGYGDYWGGGSWYGGHHISKDKEILRSGSTTSSTSRVGGRSNGAQTVIGGSNYNSSTSRNPYTVVGGSRSGNINRSNPTTNSSGVRQSNNSSYTTSRSVQYPATGNDLIRNRGTRNISGLNQSYSSPNLNTTTRTSYSISAISTRPRTAIITNTEASRNTNPAINTRTGANYNNSNTNSTSSRYTSTSTPSYNSGTRSTTYSTSTPASNEKGSRSSSSYNSNPSNNSTPTYSAPTYSSPSYNSSSSSSSSSSGSSGGGSSRSSGGSSSGGRR